MRVEPFKLASEDVSLVLALIVRRLGQVWRRAERDTPDSWLNFAERIWAEWLPEPLKQSAVGKAASDLIAGRPTHRDLTGRQAVVIWADALAAGFPFAAGSDIALESADIVSHQLPAGFPLPESASSAAEPQFWPLLDGADEGASGVANRLPRAGKLDASAHYTRLWEQISTALKQLPADETELLPELLAVLKLAAHVPVLVGAGGRVVGLADHVRTALPMASALMRAAKSRLDESPSQWVDAKQPYWLLVGVHLKPAITAITSGEFARQQEKLAALLVGANAELAAALDRPSLDAAVLGRAGAGSEILLLDAATAERLEKAVAGINATLNGAVTLGISGQPITADFFTGTTARIAPACLRVMLDARQAASQARHVGAYAELFGPAPTKSATANDWPALGPSATPASSPAVGESAAPAEGASEGASEKPQPFAATAPPMELAKPTPAPSVVGSNAVAIVAVISAKSRESDLALPFPAPAGLLAAEIVAAFRRSAAIAADMADVVPYARDRAGVPGRFTFTAPASLVPEWAALVADHYRHAWGNQPPFPLAIGLAGGHIAGVAGKKLALDPARAAWKLAARSSATVTNKSGVAACFPRHSADVRACLAVDDLPQIVRFGQQMLSLAGLRLDESTGQIAVLRRSSDSVVAACRAAARMARPEPVGISAVPSASVSRHPKWRPALMYRLNRMGPRKRAYSRKKPAPPTPAEQLVQAVGQNRWLGLDRHTSMDAALILDLAARWVELVMPLTTP